MESPDITLLRKGRTRGWGGEGPADSERDRPLELKIPLTHRSNTGFWVCFPMLVLLFHNVAPWLMTALVFRSGYGHGSSVTNLCKGFGSKLGVNQKSYLISTMSLDEQIHTLKEVKCHESEPWTHKTEKKTFNSIVLSRRNQVPAPRPGWWGPVRAGSGGISDLCPAVSCNLLQPNWIAWGFQ